MVNEKKHYIELAEKYLAHKATPQDRDELLEWMQESEPLQQLLDNDIEHAANDMPEHRRRHVYSEIMRKAQELVGDETHGGAEPRPRSKHMVTALRMLAAACVVLAVTSGVLAYMHVNGFAAASPVEIRTQATDHSQVSLPDGTLVHLNALSTLSYQIDEKGQRMVRLNGEGYFEVAPDSKHPFVISANEVQLLCLGTKFDIKNYEDDNTAKVILREGKVKVSSGEQSVLMTPGTCVTYNKATGSLSKARVQKESATDWMRGYTCYKNENLENIANELSRSYGKRIVISTPELARESFSGYLGKASLNDVLNALSVASGINYKYINDSTIYLYNNHK